MSAIPEMTPSKMFFAARSVPPGNVWTFTLPWVRSETSFAQRSIWTQGKVADGGKLAYRSVIGSAACDVPGTTNRTRKRTDRRTDNTDFAFTSASLGNGLGNLPHRPGENCPILPESASVRQPGFSCRRNDVCPRAMSERHDERPVGQTGILAGDNEEIQSRSISRMGRGAGS